MVLILLRDGAVVDLGEKIRRNGKRRSQYNKGAWRAEWEEKERSKGKEVDSVKNSSRHVKDIKESEGNERTGA